VDTKKSEIVAAIVNDLTWQGHDFLDVLRDDTQFNILKDLGKKLSLESIKTTLDEAVKIAMT